jgi:hypothetical protein
MSQKRKKQEKECKNEGRKFEQREEIVQITVKIKNRRN